MNLSLLPSLSWFLRKSACWTCFSSECYFFFSILTTSQWRSAAWVVLSYFVVVQLIYQFLCPWWSNFCSTCSWNISKKGIYLISLFWVCFISWDGLKKPWWSQLLCLKCFLPMWWWWTAQRNPPRAKVKRKRPNKKRLHLFLCFFLDWKRISRVCSLERTCLWWLSEGPSWKEECSAASWTYLAPLRRYLWTIIYNSRKSHSRKR